MFQISFWFLLISTLFHAPENGALELTVQNIQNSSGYILIALYNSPDDFPKQDKAYKVARVKAVKPRIQYAFDNIPEGDYAIAVFHDENADDELNFKLFFIPKEPYGFSNNYVPRFSKPTFDDARFSVNGQMTVEIDLVN